MIDKIKLRSIEGKATQNLEEGDLDSAYKLFDEAIKIAYQIDEYESAAMNRINQGLIFLYSKKYNQALIIFDEQEQICRRLNYSFGLAFCLSHRGNIYMSERKFDLALSNFNEAESLFRELKIFEKLVVILNNQAEIHRYSGNLIQALSLWQQIEKICLETGIDYRQKNIIEDMLSARIMLGRTLLKEENGEGAMFHFLEAERICRQYKIKELLIQTLGFIGSIYKNRGAINDALSVHKEEENLCRDLGDNRALAYSLLDQARIFCDNEQVTKGLEIYKMAEDAAYSSGDRECIFLSLYNTSYYLFSKNQDTERALSKCQELLIFTKQIPSDKVRQSKAKNLLDEINKNPESNNEKRNWWKKLF